MGKKLTQDVFNGLQKSYRYAAVDGSGRAYAYTCKPVLSDIFFMPDDSSVNSDYLNLQDYYDASDWQNSLIERQPDVMQAIADKLVGGWQESCDNSKKDKGICKVTARKNSLIERTRSPLHSISEELTSEWQALYDNSEALVGKAWVNILQGTVENQADVIAKKDETIKKLNEQIETLNKQLDSQKCLLSSKFDDGIATILTLLNLSRDLTKQLVDTITVKNLEIDELSHQIKEDGLLIDSLSHEIEALKKKESYEFSQ